MWFCIFFFFQAEDGIRDGRVTGVQTCALPIWGGSLTRNQPDLLLGLVEDVQHALELVAAPHDQDRKSTRLNSSHPSISYAVFCLKKKKNKQSHNVLAGVTIQLRESNLKTSPSR